MANNPWMLYTPAQSVQVFTVDNAIEDVFVIDEGYKWFTTTHYNRPHVIVFDPTTTLCETIDVQGNTPVVIDITGCYNVKRIRTDGSWIKVIVGSERIDVNPIEQIVGRCGMIWTYGTVADINCRIDEVDNIPLAIELPHTVFHTWIQSLLLKYRKGLRERLLNE